MKGLRELVENEIRASMIFLGAGVSIGVGLLIGFFYINQLKSDFTVVEYFILETTKNALVLEQPIMIQRSISEFWRSFEGRRSSIAGFEIYFGDSLVSQVGSIQDKPIFFDFRTRQCFPSSQQSICINYLVHIYNLLTDFFLGLIIILLSTFSVYMIRRRIAVVNVEKLVIPLENEISRISKISEEFKEPTLNHQFEALSTTPDVNFGIQEVTQLSDAYRDLLNHSRQYLELEKSAEVNKSISMLATQVAHDIRSPVTALNMAFSSLVNIPEETRDLAKNAIRRINDISNDLLNRGKQAISSPSFFKEQQERIFLVEAIEQLINEKKLEFSGLNNIRIQTDLRANPESFIFGSTSELMRLLSNLINNSVEAIGDKEGEVVIAMRIYQDIIHLSIRDNGKGIPPDVLKKLGESRISYAKDNTNSGNGLGVFHAKRTVEEMGGNFSICSKVDIGTTADMYLPIKDIRQD